MRLNRTQTIIIFSIVTVVSLMLSFFYYQYHLKVTEDILQLAISDVTSNIEIQIHDLSKILNENMDSILDRLGIVTNNENTENIEAMISDLEKLAEDKSIDLVDSYIWIDENAKLVWSSESDILPQISEIDISDQEFFSVPMTTLRPSIGSIFDTKDNFVGWYVSYPMILEQIPLNDDDNKDYNNADIESITRSEFNGIIMAVINAETMGHFLQKQIPLKYDSSIGLFSTDGDLLFATNSLFKGKNIFNLNLPTPSDNKMQDSLKSLLNNTFPNGSPVIYEIPEKKLSIAYQPLYLDYIQHQQEQKYQPFNILTLIAPHKLANDVSSLLDQERLFSILVIISIFAVNVSIALIIMMWNKTLKDAVKIKTAQLMQSNQDLQVANKQLKLQDNRQKEFIHVAAHELRTPIQVISGYTEMLLEDIQIYLSKNSNVGKNIINKEKVEDLSIISRIFAMIKAIERNSSRLYKLTSDLIDVIQIEQNGLELKKELFDLNENILDIIKDFNKLGSSYNDDDINSREIIFEKSEDSMVVFADKSRISQVIFNLLGNAVKYTKNGRITIDANTKKNNLNSINADSGPSSAILNDNKQTQLIPYNDVYNNTANNKEITVNIKDTGCGINAEIQSRLFEKFASKSEKGIGLGLYISKKIIEAHKGRIWGENNQNGIGTTFTFTLPINDEFKLFLK
ncbi:MAG: HAMP domain-containing sensor histidine kinase [Nitrososphaeraceae archaeon]